MPESPPNPRLIHFGRFELDLDSQELRKDGTTCKLQPQPFRLLAALVTRAGAVVTREQLRHELWRDEVFVDFERGLNYCVRQIRVALEDDAQEPHYIETLKRRGYRFIALVGQPVMALEADASARTVLGFRNAPSLFRPDERRAAYALISALAVTAVTFLLVHPVTHNALPLLKAVPLNALPGLLSHPAISPDGSLVSFSWDGSSGGNLAVYGQMIGDATPFRLTHSEQYEGPSTWAPDGRHIAISRFIAGRTEIFEAAAFGGTETRIASLPSEPIQDLQWSPAGDLLVCAMKLAPAGPYALFRIGLRDGKLAQLTWPPPTSSDWRLALAPDGKTIAFARDGGRDPGIYLIPAIGGKLTRLTSEEAGSVEGLTWTGDAREIVYSSSRGGSQGLWRLAVSGGQPRRLEIAQENAYDPVISRDGRRLAYARWITNSNIWRMGAAPGKTHTDPAVLVQSPGEDSSPQYSPDGKMIAFNSDRSGRPQIWLCDSGGENLRQLTDWNSPQTINPAWSPDGKQIAFASSGTAPPYAVDIYVISADGGTPRRVTHQSYVGWGVSWSRDGHWIYFSSRQNGTWQVWKVPSAGGEPLQVTERGGAWAQESSDGRYLYYSKADAPGIWRMSVGETHEEPVTDLPIVPFGGSWILRDAGIYFADRHQGQQPVINFFSLASRRTQKLVELNGQLVGWQRTLAVSPDSGLLLVSQLDYEKSFLMLVDNFH